MMLNEMVYDVYTIPRLSVRPTRRFELGLLDLTSCESAMRRDLCSMGAASAEWGDDDA